MSIGRIRNRQLVLYGLVDPVSLLLRYIGISSYGLGRPHQHALEADKDKVRHLPLYCWIRQLTAAGLKYSVVVLRDDFTTVQDLRSAEIHWIAIMRALGAPLLNISRGGLGGPLSEQSRKRISMANKGRKHTPESRAINSAAQRIAQNRPEVKAKQSAAFRKRLATDPSLRAGMVQRARRPKALATRTKMSEAARLAHARPEQKARHRLATTEASRRPETRLKKALSMRRFLLRKSMKTFLALSAM